MQLILACILLAGVTSALPANTYPTQYDKVDLDRILHNERIFKKYVDCLMDRGKCTPDAKLLKDLLPDALKTDCSKCSTAQKKMAGKALEYILRNRRNVWNELLDKYDPDGLVRKKLEYEED